MRGLVMDFPNDTTVLNIGDQFLCGPSLLINPVCNYKQRERELYLPKGIGWYDLYTGTYQPGGKRITAAAPFERMPVFVKAGAIIPFGPDLQYTTEKPADTITLKVYTGADGDFQLYEDEGTNYNYEKGRFATIPLSYNEQDRTLLIGTRNGTFPGMLLKRVFRIETISPDNSKPLEGAKASKELVYDGTAVKVKL